MDDSLVTVAGLCDIRGINFTKGVDNFWTQISIQENLNIPDIKPEIEQITGINVAVRILKKKVIVTPSTNACPNYEGKILTGRKLIVEGELCQTLSYIAARSEQPVHSARFVIPFSAFIVIPKTVQVWYKDEDQEVDSLHITYQINTCLEDVFVKKITPREVFDNVMLLLQAVPVTVTPCLDE
ncbi:conserved hypothetical protein [uncultured Sporomusa sp.]|uniref:SipL SPOCS domain-containing protein n=1 Tax=uncultured Sporomusa sp. TaxID=307249 RepID=A0A212LZG3_9FIRM|nr:DUF3794 domain-containing protein [uncultured Sporomusa sp.]SCM82789.1 conserved hypothetical protein [uncultured Sporomusa sp.]